MRQLLSVIVIGILVTSCLGSGTKGQPVEAEILLPQDLKSFSNLKFYVQLTDSSGQAVTQPSELTLDKKRYSAEVSRINAGNYLAKIQVGHMQDKLLPFGEAIVLITLKKGNPIILTLKPTDFNITVDTDNDGQNNIAEFLLGTNPFSEDTDGDGYKDGNDSHPLSVSEWIDVDGDGWGDNSDNCKDKANSNQRNTDNDLVGDACDDDDDGDGLPDTLEDLNGDGIVDAGETDPLKTDTDGDGADDRIDNCKVVKNPAENGIQNDLDGDGMGDVCDDDDDNDKIVDSSDNCPVVSNASQTDIDKDGTGDACDGDMDGDGVIDTLDNCQTVVNADQKDTDLDKEGDACDTDDDNDGLADTDETNYGKNGILTNPLTSDDDNDGILDGSDNCPHVANKDQKDTDGDTEGDACDCDYKDPGIRIQNGIFVSTNGDDTKSGSVNDPVKSVARGIAVAKSLGKDLYITDGTYNESLTIPDSIRIFGGFDQYDPIKKSCERAKGDNQSTITSAGSATLSITELKKGITLDSLVLKNSNSGTKPVTLLIMATDSGPLTISGNYIFGANNLSGDSCSVSVDGTGPLFTNNVISGGASRRSTAVELLNSKNAIFVHNTIDGGNSWNSSYGIHARKSLLKLVNNLVFVRTNGSKNSLDDQKVLYVEDSGFPAGSVIVGNLLRGYKKLEDPILYYDKEKSFTDKSKSDLSEINDSLDNKKGTTIETDNFVNKNIGSSQGLKNDLLTDPDDDSGLGADYHLTTTSDAVDSGVDSKTVINVEITTDIEGNKRPSGLERDIGAYEQP